MRGVVLASLAALAFLLAAIPAAAAQEAGTLEVKVVGLPSAPVPPQVANPAFNVTATYHCTQADALATQVTARGVVSLVFGAPDGVRVTGPAEIEMDLHPCGGAVPGDAVASDRFQVSLERSVPGLVPLPLNVTASLTRQEPVALSPQAAPATATFTVTADYYSVNQAKTDTKLRDCSTAAECAHVEFPLQLTNYGNAATSYHFTLSTAPSSGWTVTLPPDTVLDHPATAGSGTSTIVSITMSRTQGTGGEAAFGIVVTPSAAADGAKLGNAVSANFLVRDHRNVGGKALPGPAVPSLLLAMAALAAATRRRP